MSEYKIDKGVPLPGKMAVFEDDLTVALNKMEPGDSIFFPGQSIKYVPGQMNVALRARTHGHRKNRKVASRTVEENGVKGVRIWRLS